MSSRPAHRRTTCRRWFPNLEPLEARTLLSAESERSALHLYDDFLGRTPDPLGLTFWADQLDRRPIATVVADFVSNEEARSRQIQNIYRSHLDRPVDPLGHAGSLGFLDRGGTLTQLRATVIGSEEYFLTQGGGSQGGFLDALFQDVLGRAMEPEAQTFYRDVLARGISRVTVAHAVLESIEGRTGTIRRAYQEILDRPADLAGLAFFADALAGGLSETQLLAALAASAENLDAPAPSSGPFFVTRQTPEDGARDVGVTFRPQVFFSRPVDPASLTEENFFAAVGDERLSATIVPAGDGSFAWLFFDTPLPEARRVEVTVDGGTVRALGSADLLDADADGTPGGRRTFAFGTVQLTPMPNTTLTGRIVDPGPDLIPHTADDLDPGPDGLPMTGDDVFLRPLAGVAVFLLGREDEEVFTDPEGRFHFDTVPAGTVKVAMDGRTTTAPPAGAYFPEMVMDAVMVIGQENFVMPGMETTYLPRLQNTILEQVDASAPARLVLRPEGAYTLPPEQQPLLTLEIAPNSFVAADGSLRETGTVGLSVVPPELVRDMLPPGLLQHTFDITVQAMDFTNFATPAAMTFPNVFGAAPGEQLHFLSFDHTTGRLVIEGTATVAADGRSVRTDPGTGITHPGWHGLTPPGTEIEAPCPLPSIASVVVDPIPIVGLHEDGDIGPLKNHFFVSDEGGFTLAFRNDADPLEPPLLGLFGFDPCSEENRKATPLVVKIEVGAAPGTLSFTENLRSQTFALLPQQSRRIRVEITDLFPLLRQFNQDVLYGTHVTITGWRSDQPEFLLVDEEFDVYRFLDAADDNHVDGIIDFGRTAADGAGDYRRLRGLRLLVHPDAAILVREVEETTLDVISGSPAVPVPCASPLDTEETVRCVCTYDPDENDLLPDIGEIEIVQRVKDEVVGRLRVAGDSVHQEYFIDIVALTEVLRQLADGTTPGANVQQKAFLATAAARQFIVDEVVAKVERLLRPFAAGISRVTTPSDESILIDRFRSADARTPPSGPGVLGEASILDQLEVEGGLLTGREALIHQRSQLSRAELAFRLRSYLNLKPEGTADLFIDRFLPTTLSDGSTIATELDLIDSLAKTILHEIGHLVGLNHTAGADPGEVILQADGMPVSGASDDIMAQGIDQLGRLRFRLTAPALLFALGLDSGDEFIFSSSEKLVNPALDYYMAYARGLLAAIKVGGGFDGISDDANVGGPLPPLPGLLQIVTPTDQEFVTDLELGQVVDDGPGGSIATKQLLLFNAGNEDLVFTGLRLEATGPMAFAVTPLPSGTRLRPQESLPLTVTFDPATSGEFAATLRITQSGIIASYEIGLTGISQSAAGDLQLDVGNNNLGGAFLGGGQRFVGDIITVRNAGAGVLRLTGIDMSDLGIGQFLVLGMPPGLSPEQPHVLQPGESLTLGLNFQPAQAGLQRGEVLFRSDDPDTPLLRQPVVATGRTLPDSVDFGNDFVAVESPIDPSAPILRTVSDAGGHFRFFLPAERSYRALVFDPVSGLIAHVEDVSNRSGTLTRPPAALFDVSTEPDSDGDGLPNDIERAIGTSERNRDTDGDGLTDFAEVSQQLDPLGGLAFPTGLVAGLAIPGNAQALAVQVSPTDPRQRLAIVALGTAGVALVDVSTFDRPLLLSRLPLSGDIQDVAIDEARQLAVVAGGSAGLHVVDISNPLSPLLRSTILLPDGAARVEVSDGLALVAGGQSITLVDLATEEVLQTVDPGVSTITDLVREGSTLFALGGPGRLRILTLAGLAFQSRGILTLPEEGEQLFTGAGIAYVVASNSDLGGFVTVDVSDLDQPRLLSGLDSDPVLVFPRTAFAANGSGLGVLVGRSRFGQGAIDLFDVADPMQTDRFLTRFEVPGIPRAVVLAEGLAFVAAGPAGLQVVNYRSFDSLGIPPEITLTSPLLGSVMEGGSLPVQVTTDDDVQVSRVEFFLNGQLVSTDLTFPFEVNLTAPADALVTPEVVLQARATDSGGNRSLSVPLTLTVSQDTTAPTITLVTPADGVFVPPGPRSIRIDFSEPITSIDDLENAFMLLDAQGQSLPLRGLESRSGGANVVLHYSSLTVGRHRLSICFGVLTDRAGNQLESGGTTLEFTVQDVNVSWIGGSGMWSDPTHWSTGQVPGPADNVLIQVAGDITVSLEGTDTFTVGQLSSDETLRLADRSRLTVTGSTSLRRGLRLEGGILNVSAATVFGESQWVGGTLLGKLTNLGTMQVMGNSSKTLGSDARGGTLVNQGTIHDHSGGVFFHNGTWTNDADSTHELQEATGYFSLGGMNQIAHRGTLRSASAPGGTTVQVPVTSTDAGVEVLSGGLNLQATTSWTGSELLLRQGARLQLGGPTHTFDLRSAVRGEAETVLEIGNTNGEPTSATIASVYSVEGRTQLQSDSQVTFTGGASTAELVLAGGGLAGQLTVTGQGTWSTGEVTGTLFNRGVLTISPDPSATLRGTLNNEGRIIHIGGALILAGGTLENRPGAEYDLQSSSGIADGGGSNQIQNHGLLRRRTAGTTVIGVPVVHHGELLAEAGTLSFRVPLQQTGGTTILAGGNLVVGQGFDLMGGLLQGVGTITGNLVSGGIVSPGVSPGRLVVTGQYTQTPAGRLLIELSGDAPGTRFDQLAVGSRATLAGLLEIRLSEGFQPVEGDTFAILSSLSLSGEFTEVLGRAVGEGLTLELVSGNSGVTLRVAR